MKLKRLFILNLISIASMLALVSLSDPESLNLLFASFFLVLAYFFAVTLVLIILQLAYEDQFNSRKKLLISMIIGVIAPMLLAISSLSSLSGLDIILVLSVPIIIVWYIQKKNIF